MIPRTKDYRLFTMRGVVQPPLGGELRLRNDLYLIGSLRLNYSNTKSVKVRLAGYEFPLQEETTQGKCFDLFGYDSEHNPYIIELKTGRSPDKLVDIVNQINGYEEQLKPLLGYVEMEIQEKLLIEEFT